MFSLKFGFHCFFPKAPPWFVNQVRLIRGKRLLQFGFHNPQILLIWTLIQIFFWRFKCRNEPVYPPHNHQIDSKCVAPTATWKGHKHTQNIRTTYQKQIPNRSRKQTIKFKQQRWTLHPRRQQQSSQDNANRFLFFDISWTVTKMTLCTTKSLQYMVIWSPYSATMHH